ncbi:Serine protease SplF precursor [Rubinisphaera italica]|uniref:Serine protease SplF n=1 Tax=Rubinisphaera italica TaxID=2527969 RepID=A0A5C5XG44_9PLAN|nr:Serine protease SplF precursor [Rubinisphaera italica]
MKIETIIILILFLGILSGCDKIGSQEAPPTVENTVSPPAYNPYIDPQTGLPIQAPKPPAKDYELTVTTDIYGTTIRVKDAVKEEVIDSKELTRGDLEAKFTIPTNTDYIVEVEGYGNLQQIDSQKMEDDQTVELKLDLLFGSDFRELLKSATCLVQMPDGGFGSGFLYGDRQTIVTAAHCVAAKNVGDLTYTFFPDEDREVTFKDARLMFYDQKQDVAVLRLPEPVPADHYWLWSAGTATNGADVMVMGNPGRNGEYDPMYARTCKVADVRPDEFRLDVEIYPGYSGGPVVLEGTSEVIGIVSYKIIRSTDYQQLGYSFARSGDIAADAYEQWNSLATSDLQERSIERVEERYSREFGRHLANSTAAAYYGDSAVYTLICMSLTNDYRMYMIKKIASLPPLTLSQRNLVMRNAHKEYIKDVAPEIAEKVRERVSPKLRGTNVDKDHELVMADESVNEVVKKSLVKAREGYLELKEAAETIVKQDGGKDRSADEFEKYVVDLWSDVRFHSEEVLDSTASR